MPVPIRALPAVAAALVLSAAAACSDTATTKSANQPGPQAQSTVTTTGGSGTTTLPLSTNRAGTTTVMSVPELVKTVRPSVVRVQATGGTGVFGQQNSGTGTGFVIDARGYIVTNNHVVTLGSTRPASSVKVELSDGRTVDATIVGRDQSTDLAVLKVDAGNLPALKFADPASIEIGEQVVAVGFPLDLGTTPTVTTGVVSAKDRVIEEQLEGSGAVVSISGAIQTDAAINPGNSGGPLLNLRGEVVGINTAGLYGGLGRPVQGISFAVSSQVAQPIVQTLIEKGQVTRGFLGVGVVGLDRDTARQRGFPVNEGVYLLRVDPGSPADRAGLRQGDIVVKIGDTEIKSVGDVTHALTRYTPGTKVKVEYYRGNDKRTADVTTGERPAELR